MANRTSRAPKLVCAKARPGFPQAARPGHILSTDDLTARSASSSARVISMMNSAQPAPAGTSIYNIGSAKTKATAARIGRRTQFFTIQESAKILSLPSQLSYMIYDCFRFSETLRTGVLAGSYSKPVSSGTEPAVQQVK